MFTQEQLKKIKKIARSVKNQGEIAVFKKLNEDSDFTNQQIDIIGYCAAECKRQHSGEMSVYDMVNAWSMVQERKAEDWNPDFQLTTPFIEYIGKIVEPIDNAKGFRTIPIGVTDGMGGWIEKAAYYDIQPKLEMLLNAYYSGAIADSSPGISEYPIWNKHSQSAEDEFYFQFEEIHPFRDGNGRTGKILYNYLKGTLDNPVIPPNFWGGSNP